MEDAQQTSCNEECSECWDIECPDSPNYYKASASLEECQNCGATLNEDEQDIAEAVWQGELHRFCCSACADEWTSDQQATGSFYDEDYLRDYLDFRDPGGRSALRNGPRIHPCPNCGEPDVLTPRDIELHYQCDRCADELERGW